MTISQLENIIMMLDEQMLDDDYAADMASEVYNDYNDYNDYKDAGRLRANVAVLTDAIALLKQYQGD